MKCSGQWIPPFKSFYCGYILQVLNTDDSIDIDKRFRRGLDLRIGQNGTF